MFAQAIEDILQDQCTPAVVRAIEAGGSPLKLWQALQGAGFLELLASEVAGGAGLALAELFPMRSTSVISFLGCRTTRISLFWILMRHHEASDFSAGFNLRRTYRNP